MEKSKEQRYEDLVNAMSKGELGMVKFLWGLVTEIDEKAEKIPESQIKKRTKKLDDLISKIEPLWNKLQANPPKDGKTPSRSELESIIKPLIPRPIPGEDAEPPSEEYLLELIESVMPDPIPDPL